MRVVCAGKVLKDHTLSLAQYGIKEGSTIHVVRGAPGPQQGADVTKLSSSSSSPSSSQDPMGMMMSNPLIKHLTSDPQTMKHILTSNPSLRRLAESNPEIGALLNNPSFLQSAIQSSQNPELYKELQRNNDRAIANLESVPGGFEHLRKMYTSMQAPMESAMRPDRSTDAQNEHYAKLFQVQDTPDHPEEVNDKPLPNPW
ncbi:MAG: hypothetical protein DHS80DRAFT_14930, partial [Piptocephalis tieghemiana]